MLAIPFGLAFAVALPPSAAPDEGYHLGRVWTLCEGHLRLPGPGDPPLSIPRSIPELFRAVNGERIPSEPPRRSLAELGALLSQPLAPARRVNLNLGGAYPPLTYAATLIGVGIGRALGLPAAALFYLGRATNLGAWIALSWLAIRLCPLRRWTLALLALAPMSIAMAASVSADPVTSAAALLFLALVMRTAVGRSGPLARAELVALLGSALLLGTAKAGYWALAAAPLLIPAERCGGRGRLAALAAAVAFAVLAPSAWWLAEVRASGALASGSGVDPAAHIGRMLADPIGFAGMLAATVAKFAGPWLRGFIGVLGQLTVRLPAFAYWAYAAALAVAMAADGPQPALLTIGRRLLLLAIFLGCALAIIGLLYVGSNAPDAAQVNGVQGRYFIPGAPALLLALPSLPRPLPRAAQLAIFSVAAAVGSSAVAAVLARFYAF